jgi:hypothetical protein
VWLGEALLEWVTIAVCEPCAGMGSSGLLGLNVTGQFQVELDHDDRSIVLTPAQRFGNRALDVGQWLELSARMRAWPDGRRDIRVQHHNRAPVAIASATVELACADERFEVDLEPTPARTRLTTRMTLPRGEGCETYTVDLVRASWEPGH